MAHRTFNPSQRPRVENVRGYLRYRYPESTSRQAPDD